jgi:putative ABC transport system ATP-binding protein
MAADSSPLIVATDVSRTYHLGVAAVPAVRGVSLSIARGECHATRPDGLPHLHRLQTGGRDQLDERTRPWGGADEDAKEPREPALRPAARPLRLRLPDVQPHPCADLGENVAYPMVLAQVPAAERRRRRAPCCRRWGWRARRASARPASGGQRQRASRSRGPSPTSPPSSSPTSRRPTSTATPREEILDLMREINAAREVAFLFATHDPRGRARPPRRDAARRRGRVGRRGVKPRHEVAA